MLQIKKFRQAVIVNFKHKGLEEFFKLGKSAKINPSHLKRLRLILAKLNTVVQVADMNFPGSDLHPLKGDRKDFWSVSVNGNWRVIFRLEDEKVYDVDYLDYH
jgi:toxin HigB-1